MTTSEEVVLLDEAGHAIGTASKTSVHSTRTPLHLAFSCYVFDTSGRLLVTRRALDKATFPGVWSNSLCGHPSPGENITRAVERRAKEELGMDLTAVRLVLPAFRYRAVMPNGVCENEMCPVFTAVTDTEPHPEPSEVEAAEWVAWPDFRDEVLSGARSVSVWCVEQVTQLARLEVADASFAPGSYADLPPAARPSPESAQG